MSEPTQPTQPTPAPVVRARILAHSIRPDNDLNIWGDYHTLFIFHARTDGPTQRLEMTAPTKEDVERARVYILYGDKGGKGYTKVIEFEEANQIMRDEFFRETIKIISE